MIIFFFIDETKIANYADDTTTYTIEDNVTKSNEVKCHLFVANKENVSELGNDTIDSSETVKLLGVLIDKQLNSNEHVSKLCKKGNQKLHTLARIPRYLSKDKLTILVRALSKSEPQILNKA